MGCKAALTCVRHWLYLVTGVRIKQTASYSPPYCTTHTNLSKRPDRNAMWVKTHAPQAFDEMVGNPELVQRFAMMCKTRYLQHMILCGPPGVGKSRLVQLLIDNLLGKAQHEAVLQFNSADERSNQVIREKIHQFVPKKVTVSSPKLVVFRQAEQLGEGVQQIMRRLMECHYHHAVFIFVCSDLNGMLETLQSRCHIFRFAPVSVAQQVPYLRAVATKEGVAADDAALGLIATLSNGDMRSSLNYLQAACCALEAEGEGGEQCVEKPTNAGASATLDADTVRSVCLFPHYQQVERLFDTLLAAAGQAKEEAAVPNALTAEGFRASLSIVRALYDQGYCGRDLVMFLSTYLMTASETMPTPLHLGFVKDVALGHQRLAKGIDSYVQLAGIVAALYRRSVAYRAGEKMV